MRRAWSLQADLLKKAEKAGVRMLIPVDVVCGKEFKNDTDTAVFKSSEMPQDMMGLDIGPATVELYKKEIFSAKTVVWNGPMGVFEGKLRQRHLRDSRSAQSI